MRNSLFNRIAFPYVGLIIVLLVAGSIYFSSFVKNAYLESWRANLESDARVISEQINGYLYDELGLLQEAIQNSAEIMGIRVTIIASDGTVIGDTEALPTQVGNHRNRPEVMTALAGNIGYDVRKSVSLGKNMVYVSVPIYQHDQIIGISRTSVSLATLDQSISTLQRTIIGIVAITAILVIILALLITRYTMEPLNKLTEMVTRIEGGVELPTFIYQRDDEVGKLSVAFMQMTKRLREQIEVFKLEQSTLNAVLTHMTDAVIIVDGEGLVQLSNPAAERMFNVNQADAVGRSMVEVLRHHQLIELWQNCIESEKQKTTTLEIMPNKMFVQGIATPMGDVFPGAVLIVLQDLTRLRKLEKIRSDFVSNVSHELRTPLASIRALTETLQEGALEDPPAARRFLSRMEIEIDNLTQMVQELLELSKIESGRVPLRKKFVPARELMEKAVERMQVQVERSGLQLTMEIPGDLPTVLADPERVGQVFVNLIHNAIKFTPPGGNICVKAVPEKNKVIFSVADNGVGIESDALLRIFERFYKTDRARTTGGTGLGLSITKHIIEGHGGQVWVESEIGKGSAFFFTIPTT
jgi:two-component system phosphate regulon sensor histidine kinase PhoR